MIKVKCYGGPAHGHEMLVSGRYRFDVTLESRLRHHKYARSSPDDFREAMLGYSALEYYTYYLKTYQQEGTTAGASEVYRQKQVAILEGADLLPRELHELEDAMDHTPWTWKQNPSILYQFEAWWEKALHNTGWEKARVYY